jgi:hypothetical protein
VSVLFRDKTDIAGMGALGRRISISPACAAMALVVRVGPSFHT